MAANTKIIGGRPYILRQLHATKLAAQVHARQYKARGRPVRVFRVAKDRKSYYAVYSLHGSLS